MSECAPLHPDRIDAGVGALWRPVQVVAETGSTNADLLARAAAGADIEGAVLLAEHQTAGRGRHGRQWDARPRTQIMCSVGVGTTGVPAARWGWLPLAAGLAVLDGLHAGGVEAGLKWPNDVLVGDAKLAGILAEVAVDRTVVVGIGLNVHGVPAGLPDRPGPPGAGATSVAALGGPAPDRDELAIGLLRALHHRVQQWRAGSADLARDYRQRCVTLGRSVRALRPAQPAVVGVARAIDAAGRCEIATAAGEMVAVSAGDIVHLRDDPAREA